MDDAPPINVQVADLPPGTSALVIGTVEPDEMLPGETVVEALVRLKRAVVVKE